MERLMQAGSEPMAQRGFTYVTVMAVVALLGIGLAAMGPMWSEAAQREMEQDLLRVGTLYAQAIDSYYAVSPGSVKRYPPNLDSLVLDTRFVGTRRHLRRLYADPLQPSRQWGLVRAPDGGVRGVYSLDERRPFARASLTLDAVSLPAVQRYVDWKFMPKDPS